MKNWKDFLRKAYLMGIGMATGAYDLFIINFVMLVLGDLYGLGAWESSLVATSSLAGTFTGPILFGILGDKIGRKKSSVLTCIFLLIGAIGSGFVSYNIAGITLILYIMLAFWRFLVGIGIGGEFPVTAIFTGESSDSELNDKRGKYISFMFSSQGIGNIVACCYFLFLLLVFKTFSLNIIWRTALVSGAIPPLLILIPRYKMNESNSYNNEKEKKVSIKKTIKIYWKNLIGTAGCWFCFDLVFYIHSLFSGPILEAVGIADETGWEAIRDNVSFNVIMAFISLPGYWFAAFFIDKIGRKPLQLFGFLMMAVIYVAIGVSYQWLTRFSWAFIVLYGFSYFFANAGPNTTTFVIPSETYPAIIRSTCYGFSAACGKFGAILGSFFLGPILSATSPQFIFVMCGIISFIGIIITFFFIKETKGIDLLELDKEITPKLLKDDSCITLV